MSALKYRFKTEFSIRGRIDRSKKAASGKLIDAAFSLSSLKAEKSYKNS